ncbi:hypothetical protein ACIBCA_03710 [Kitasatospora sp. NPDC051170]|uniref:hypothetical protein n=1 Tax=Kitasatospora sp. NPDC051170 TaxID=3364056 RepID=UPI0037918373
MRRTFRRLAALAAVPLIALTGATAAQAASGSSRVGYSVVDSTGTCQINVTFYRNSNNGLYYVQYVLKNLGNGTQGCAAGAYASDDGYVGYITGGAFSTNDDGSRWVQPYVQRVGDSSTTRWGYNR